MRQKRHGILTFVNGKNDPVRNLFGETDAEIPGRVFITAKTRFALYALCLNQLVIIAAITFCILVKIMDWMIINFHPITAFILFECPVVASPADFLHLPFGLIPRNS